MWGVLLRGEGEGRGGIGRGWEGKEKEGREKGRGAVVKIP